MRTILTLCVVLLAVSTVALAADAEAEPASDGFQPPAFEHGNTFLPLLIAGGAMLLVAAVTFKNAKRTHLD